MKIRNSVIAGVQYLRVYFSLGIATIAIFLNIRKNKEIRYHFSLHLPFSVIRRLLVLGAPTALVMSLNSLMMVNYNAVLNRFSSTAVAVFGACCRVTGFCYTECSVQRNNSNHCI